MPIREYSSVQGAVDSLGDPIPGNDVKEFYGIISAALNSQGVAEWVVFYSNTNVDTRNNVNGPVSYMDVDVRIKIGANGEASMYLPVAFFSQKRGMPPVSTTCQPGMMEGPPPGPCLITSGVGMVT